MCGIAGILNFNGQPVNEHSLIKMAEVLRHRGPDGSGIWINPGEDVGLSHRRLAIIELTEKGSQPMHYADGRYTIIFNGEIYNYIELRDWLIRLKYEFKSESDSEVILALFDYKREDCLGYLDGMFSFAIWDEKEKMLFCARDRFGEKPFFYRETAEKFIFGSEIKALRTVDPAINISLDKVQKYIDINYKPEAEDTFFDGISILPAAHYLTIKNARAELTRYWQIDLYKRTKYVRESQYVEHFYDLFRRSVARRLRSDVNVGSSLSGGLDSTAVVSCIREFTTESFKTFSARFHNHKQDEGKWIEIASDHAKVENISVYPDLDGFISETDHIIYHQEFPFSSASVYAQWCVMKMAVDNNVKVLLDGQGADEYLAGYDNLKYFAIWELYRKGKFLSFRKEVQLLKKNFGSQKSVGLKFMYDPILNLLGKRRDIYDKGYTLRERLKYAMENELDELLRLADRNSMSHSLEVRLPFLSHQLVEFTFSVPPEMIYHHGNTKYILRQASRRIIPSDIYHRKDKIGFAPPDADWKLQKQFVSLADNDKNILAQYNLTTGPDAFRNHIAARFVKVFGKI